MLPVTPRISSLPARLISRLGRLLVLHAEAHLGLRDLLERAARGLGVPRLDLRRRAAIQLASALGREHDEEITVGHLVQGLLEGRKGHHSGTSRSGNLSVRRLVRHRSARMISASWSTASFTSRLMIK